MTFELFVRVKQDSNVLAAAREMAAPSTSDGPTVLVRLHTQPFPSRIQSRLDPPFWGGSLLGITHFPRTHFSLVGSAAVLQEQAMPTRSRCILHARTRASSVRSAALLQRHTRYTSRLNQVLTYFLSRQTKWASHVSYSNDVSLVQDKTGNPVRFENGKLVSVVKPGFLEY